MVAHTGKVAHNILGVASLAFLGRCPTFEKVRFGSRFGGVKTVVPSFFVLLVCLFNFPTQVTQLTTHTCERGAPSGAAGCRNSLCAALASLSSTRRSASTWGATVRGTDGTPVAGT